WASRRRCATTSTRRSNLFRGPPPPPYACSAFSAFPRLFVALSGEGTAARFRARARDLPVPGRIGAVAAARDRPHRRGMDPAVLDEAVVDVDPDHLSDHDVALRRLAVEILEIDDL